MNRGDLNQDMIQVMVGGRDDQYDRNYMSMGSVASKKGSAKTVRRISSKPKLLNKEQAPSEIISPTYNLESGSLVKSI